MNRTHALVGLAICVCCTLHAASPKTENLIFVMTDGLRWQEVFRGADPALLNKKVGGVADLKVVRDRYWDDNVEQRRKKLMPFVWNTMVSSGQLYGDRDRHSDAYVTNQLNFSYPGYSEALCGLADSSVKSNDKVLNPNKSVFEWLNEQPAFHGRVAAFAAWDVFPFIFNAPRAQFPINAGYDPFTLLPDYPEVALLNRLKVEQPHYWDEEPFDALPFRTGIEYLKAKKPKLLFLSLGETDDWAHEKRYDLYLEAAHRTDDYLKFVWETIATMPEYRGRTTLVFGTDHGRGSGKQWSTHGEKVRDSKYVFMMFMGPDTAPLGDRSDVPAVNQSQIAGTISALLGQNFDAAVPQSAPPINDVLPSGMH
jgi:hypothetical protein